jgi:hypothetical protein
MDRFDNYSALTARFASTATCGHEIAKGDPIGWNRGNRRTMCSACWAKWVGENREAAAYEQTGSDCTYDY